MKQTPQAYPDNQGPIYRPDGSYVIYDQPAAGSTSNPWLPGHRGWMAVGPNGQYLGYYPRRWRRGGRSKMCVPCKYKTAAHALTALAAAFPLSGITPEGDLSAAVGIKSSRLP